MKDLGKQENRKAVKGLPLKRRTRIGMLYRRVSDADTEVLTPIPVVSAKFAKELGKEAFKRGSKVGLIELPDVGGGPTQVFKITDRYFGVIVFRIDKRYKGDGFVVVVK